MYFILQIVILSLYNGQSLLIWLFRLIGTFFARLALFDKKSLSCYLFNLLYIHGYKNIQSCKYSIISLNKYLIKNSHYGKVILTGFCSCNLFKLLITSFSRLEGGSCQGKSSELQEMRWAILMGFGFRCSSILQWHIRNYYLIRWTTQWKHLTQLTFCFLFPILKRTLENFLNSMVMLNNFSNVLKMITNIFKNLRWAEKQ